MSTTDRRQRHRASLRREILDAASQLFVEEGYHRLTMRRLAERIEYSPTTIYLYFKDKNELLGAVCEETFSRLAGKLERLQKTAGTPMGHLREGLRTYIEFGLAHPNQYLVTFMSPSPAMDGASFEGSAGSRAFDTLRRSVRACAEHGDIHTPDVEMTAQALWAGVHGVTSLFITMNGFPFVDKAALVEHTIDTLTGGLKTPAATPRTAAQARSKKWDFFD
ncbi:MAG: TetR/AcrR family transcriptional regulator [Vicinamibacterales bacterium]|jgi:AcrR family transcriptional regulator|nr:TetR/AcrR family transcriptional regulator [Vicinamibacterales bacterium]